jgi:hypothetical protein
MTERYRQILEVLRRIKKASPPEAGLSEARKRIADAYNRELGLTVNTVSAKWRKELFDGKRQPLREDGFDRLVSGWLYRGSTELREVLIRNATGKADERAVAEFFGYEAADGGIGALAPSATPEKTDVPLPEAFLEEARREPKRKLITDHTDTIRVLRDEKKFTFSAIADWFAARGFQTDRSAVYRAYLLTIKPSEVHPDDEEFAQEIREMEPD